MFTKKVCIFVICASVAAALADCPLAHTHIGVNPTWRPDWSAPADPQKATDIDDSDNNKLWFFSIPPVHPSAATPGWPRWQQENGEPFLVLEPVFDAGQTVSKADGSGKILWTCSFNYSSDEGYGGTTGLAHIDGWHSAHGPQGAWNLQSSDEQTAPPWQIGIIRERTSLELEEDFFMLQPDDTSVLTEDGVSFEFTKQWLPEKGAWGFHEHLSFYFWLPADFQGQQSVTFSAFDNGGIYESSADFTIVFAREVCLPPAGDINGDCNVDINDFVQLAAGWLASGSYSEY